MADKDKKDNVLEEEVGSSDELDELITQFKSKTKEPTEEHKERKPVRAMKTINTDGRLLTTYETLKKEGYNKSFDDFLVDAAMNYAKNKYGIDLVVEKSLNPENSNDRIIARKKKDNENYDNNDDEIDNAIEFLLGGFGGMENPKMMVLQTLLEQKRLEQEEKRAEIERRRLENEKIRAEIDRMKKETESKELIANKENIVPTPPRESLNENILKTILEQNQKFYETVYKVLVENNKGNNPDLELLKSMMSQQKEYYENITNFIYNNQQQKINELEEYVKSNNPMQWIMAEADKFKMLREVFGGGSQKTPEEIEKEYEFQLKKLEMEREDRRTELEERRAEKLTEAIKEGLSSFSESIAKPIGQAVSTHIQNMAQNQQRNGNNQVSESIPKLKRRNINIEPEKNETAVIEQNNENNHNETIPLDIYFAPSEEKNINNTNNLNSNENT